MPRLDSKLEIARPARAIKEGEEWLSTRDGWRIYVRILLPSIPFSKTTNQKKGGRGVGGSANTHLRIIVTPAELEDIFVDLLSEGVQSPHFATALDIILNFVP